MGSTLHRTRTDEESIEQLAEADGRGTHVIELDFDVSPGLLSTVTSASQVQDLDDVLDDEILNAEPIDRLADEPIRR